MWIKRKSLLFVGLKREKEALEGKLRDDNMIKKRNDEGLREEKSWQKAVDRISSKKKKVLNVVVMQFTKFFYYFPHGF